MQKARTQTRQRSEAQETKTQQVAKKEEIQMTRAAATKKDQRSETQGTKTKQTSEAKATKEPIKNVKKEQKPMNTVAANKTVKTGKKETKATSTAKAKATKKKAPFKIPGKLTFAGADELTDRLKDETYRQSDPRAVKKERDNAYIYRLQHIVQYAHQKMAKEGKSELMNYLLNRAIEKARKLAVKVCTYEINGLDEDTIEQTAQDFISNINKGQYKGKSVRSYISMILKSVQRREFAMKHNLSATEEDVIRALRRLEKEAALDGLSPEEIPEDERYEAMIEGGVSKKSAERYKGYTSDMLKSISIDARMEAGYDFSSDADGFDLADYGEGSFMSVFDIELMKRHPLKNPVIRELVKEDWLMKDIIKVGVILMYIGYTNLTEPMKLSTFCRRYSDDILAFCERVDEDAYKTDKKNRKRDEIRQVEAIVRDVLELRANEGAKRDIKQILALVCPEEVGPYIRGELYGTVFDDFDD